MTLAIKPNDIVIFVGPNNSGKSQSLRDIYSKVADDTPSIVVKDVILAMASKDELIARIKSGSREQEQGVYIGYGYRINQLDFSFYGSKQRMGDNLRNYLVSFLKTENRLTISSAPKVIEVYEPKTHPIHYVFYDKAYQAAISKYFNEAFGYELIPNYLSRTKIPLLLGNIPQRDGGGSLPEIMTEMEMIIGSYPRLGDQGDGMRSFAGVILHLILENYGMYLIDEPESFLHPPQARILGKVIGEMLGDNRQAFISTHSEDIIKGLMEKCPERIKVIRITREGNTNSFAVLDNEQFENIWGDPLLKHSNIMSSLFHKNVVICESDSDCRLYSIVLDNLKQQEGKYSEALFIHCGGKQRMWQVAKALKSLSVDFRCVPDIDVFNDKQVLKSLYEACGGAWNESMESNYNTFANQLNGGQNSMSRQELQERINTFLMEVANENLTRNDLENLARRLRIDTKWGTLKKGGVDSIPSGQATTAFNALHESLKQCNIYPVTVGELERFVREVGGHGPSWINSVLEKYPSLDDEVYTKVKEFVKSWNL